MNKHILDTESALIQRCKQDDRQAQAQLYQRYSRGMLNVAYRILYNEEDAKDVLQDSFLKAFRELKNLKNIQGFGGWLKRIVINTSINHLKRKGLDIVPLNPIIENQLSENGVDNNIPANWDLQTAKKALMQLPDGYRTVLTLYLIEGYDHEEISQILGISKSTSLTQYSRGKKKLKELISDMQSIKKH